MIKRQDQEAVIFRLPAETKKQLQIKVLQEGSSVQEALEKFVNEYLEGRNERMERDLRELSAAEIWERYVGSQSVQDFIDVDPPTGEKPLEAIVKEYTDHLEDMFPGEEFTDEEKEIVYYGLLEYIEENGYSI